MSHLLDALERVEDIGHYSRLTFAMAARHVMDRACDGVASACPTSPEAASDGRASCGGTYLLCHLPSQKAIQDKQQLGGMSPGWSRNWRIWTALCATPCKPVPSGASRRTCCAVCPASGRPPPTCSWLTGPSWASSTTRPAPRSWALPRSTARAARCAGGASSGVDGRGCAPPCTWSLWWRCAPTRSSAPFTSACARLTLAMLTVASDVAVLVPSLTESVTLEVPLSLQVR
jgi:hypothetical protein